MLVYTTLFTLAGKMPKDNKYIAMFYIWFSYLKKYSGLGPGDTVGVIMDEETLNYINEDDNPYFSCIANDANFELELCVMPRPATLSDGFAQRYNMEHFSNFQKHKINLHLDIDCLPIKNIHLLFEGAEDAGGDLFIMPEMYEGMTHKNYAGHFVEECPIAKKMCGFSAGWYAWKWGEGIKEFFADVSKGLAGHVGEPLYTVDQPFFNYEIYLRVSGKASASASAAAPVPLKAQIKISIMDSKIVSLNTLFSGQGISDSFFANFCGEPGVEDCHFYKMLAFMCMDFSSSKTS